MLFPGAARGARHRRGRGLAEPGRGRRATVGIGDEQQRRRADVRPELVPACGSDTRGHRLRRGVVRAVQVVGVSLPDCGGDGERRGDRDLQRDVRPSLGFQAAVGECLQFVHRGQLGTGEHLLGERTFQLQVELRAAGFGPATRLGRDGAVAAHPPDAGQRLFGLAPRLGAFGSGEPVRANRVQQDAFGGGRRGGVHVERVQWLRRTTPGRIRSNQ